MNKNREQGTGNREQGTEKERHEAATLESVGELKFEVERRNVPLSHFPSGADGTEPGKPVSEEARQKLEQSVIRMRQKLTKIADLALAAEAKSNNANVKLGSKYLENATAIAEIRRICKESAAEEICPDYEWLARIMTGAHFEPECLAKAIETEASKRPIKYPTFYTPGWLCELAKKIAGDKGGEGVPPSQRKHTMGFGRFHVTRAAIPGRTILTFRRKQEVDEKAGSLVEGRIIVADIYKVENSDDRPAVHYSVKSYMDRDVRTIFSGDALVCRSRVEKMIHVMVKKLIKETHRRREVHKRRAAERREESANN